MDIFPQSLTNIISQESSYEVSENIITTQLGDGRVYRVSIGQRPILRKWTITYRGMTNAKKSILDLFWKQHGIIRTFYWTPPDGVQGIYIFDTSGLSFTDNGVASPHTRYNVQFTLEEVDYVID